jgi:hypothetical protein
MKTTMKTSLLTIAAAMIIAATAQARIGWNLEQCRTNYGHEVKLEKAWCGGTAYGFVSNGLYIYAITGSDGKISDVSYFDNKTADKISPLLKQQLLRLNQAGFQYELQLTGWDGKHHCSSLGLERFAHAVIYQPSSFLGLVENDNKNGYQVRTLKQFQIEQSVLKTYPSKK